MIAELKEKKKGNHTTKYLEEKIKRNKATINLKEAGKNISTGTSKTNYIDPRLAVAWGKSKDMDIKGIYTTTLQRKFKWAIDSTSSEWDYDKTILLPGFEQLEPSADSTCPQKTKNGKKDHKSEYVENLNHLENKKLLDQYVKMLKTYGYVLIKNKNLIEVQRSSPVNTLMGVKDTYKTIYEMSEKLHKEGLVYLSLIFIQEICSDATKYEIIKKGLKTSGYVDKFKKLVENVDNI